MGLSLNFYSTSQNTTPWIIDETSFFAFRNETDLCARMTQFVPREVISQRRRRDEDARDRAWVHLGPELVRLCLARSFLRQVIGWRLENFTPIWSSRATKFKVPSLLRIFKNLGSFKFPGTHLEVSSLKFSIVPFAGHSFQVPGLSPGSTSKSQQHQTQLKTSVAIVLQLISTHN